MNLSAFLKKLPGVEVNGPVDFEITEIVHDSRKAHSTAGFIALKGHTVDGHDYIDAAIQNGARLIFYNQEADLSLHEGVTYVALKDTEEALPFIAVNFYNYPSDQMTMIGVTGTNGKTSITLMLESMLSALNCNTALIGTIENHIGKVIFETQNTTPDALTLNAFLASARDKSTSHVLMEVSSHALKLDRVKYMHYDYAVFTNLTEDHLDFHHDFEDYFYSKAMLFQRAQKGVMINLEDSYGRRLIDENLFTAPLTTYGLSQVADVYASDISYSPKGTNCNIVTPNGIIAAFINIPGNIYVLNTLACVATLFSMGYPNDDIQRALTFVKPVRGRLETIENPKNDSIIVDFAHTPDALENVLKVVRGFTKGRLITVFGCGGDRDRKKRPIMGEIAYRLSDLVVVTSDNPRTEEPEKILDDIFEGIPREVSPEKRVYRNSDRRGAIHMALDEVKEGDTVVIAGKGHETYQILGKVKYHFDDAEEVRKFYEK